MVPSRDLSFHFGSSLSLTGVSISAWGAGEKEKQQLFRAIHLHTISGSVRKDMIKHQMCKEIGSWGHAERYILKSLIARVERNLLLVFRE